MTEPLSPSTPGLDPEPGEPGTSTALLERTEPETQEGEPGEGTVDHRHRPVGGLEPVPHEDSLCGPGRHRRSRGLVAGRTDDVERDGAVGGGVSQPRDLHHGLAAAGEREVADVHQPGPACRGHVRGHDDRIGDDRVIAAEPPGVGVLREQQGVPTLDEPLGPAPGGGHRAPQRRREPVLDDKRAGRVLVDVPDEVPHPQAGQRGHELRVVDEDDVVLTGGGPGAMESANLGALAPDAVAVVAYGALAGPRALAAAKAMLNQALDVDLAYAVGAPAGEQCLGLDEADRVLDRGLVGPLDHRGGLRVGDRPEHRDALDRGEGQVVAGDGVGL